MLTKEISTPMVVQILYLITQYNKIMISDLFDDGITCSEHILAAILFEIWKIYAFLPSQDEHCQFIKDGNGI